MRENQYGRVGAHRLLLCCTVAMTCAGCVNGDGSGTTGAVAAAPVSGSYDCGEDGSIAVEQGAGAVRLTAAEGEAIEIPASPPGQQDRYSNELYAIVFEGEEAFFMKSGKPPLTCTR